MSTDNPKPKVLKITPPHQKIEPVVIEYPVVLKPKFMMQFGPGEPFAVPPECIEIVEK